jgi:hypothetical protein
MTIEKSNPVKLTAADGMVLTNGKAYGKIVYLGINDRADNWREITEAEMEAMTAEVTDAELLARYEEALNLLGVETEVADEA